MSRRLSAAGSTHQHWDLGATADIGAAAKARTAREAIDDDGLRLLSKLAGKLSLEETAAGFPHVVNRLGLFVHEPAFMVKAIDRLLVPDRPGREGFPFTVVRELANLRERYARYHEIQQARQHARGWS
ncbi:MAG: hypothetical protein AB7P21_03905 [Lautropia sp.]